MRRFVAGVVVCAFAIACAAIEVRAASCEGAAGFAIVSISVVEDSAGKPALSQPADVVIYKDPGPNENGKVCFVVRGLAWRQSLKIVAKPDDQQQGGSSWQNPFPGLSILLKRGRAGNFAASPAPKYSGTWTYRLDLMKGGDVLHAIDPVIIIKPGGGGDGSQNIGPDGD